MNKNVQDIWIDLYQELNKFIVSKVKDPDQSEDILQDVFEKVHVKIHTLKDSSKLTSWVYQITRNTIADHFRRKQMVIPATAVDLAEQEANEPLYVALSDCINSKINLLSPNYKEAILLTSFENYSQIELAEKLEISYSGAKTRVQRAREQLKDMITGCENLETDQDGNPTDFHSADKNT